MKLPQVVSQAEWQVARDQLLVKEKEATRARDALAAERRLLPVVRFDKGYAFEGPGGPASLVDLFDGRRQLVLHHFMFPAGGDPCDGCSMFTDTVGHLAHLHARDTSFALVSPASVAEIVPFRERMGWSIPWFSTAGTFLDLTPLGRQESWEDSPDGYPQTAPYEWWRFHDTYDA